MSDLLKLTHTIIEMMERWKIPYTLIKELDMDARINTVLNVIQKVKPEIILMD